jgi:hypothetical protein
MPNVLLVEYFCSVYTSPLARLACKICYILLLEMNNKYKDILNFEDHSQVIMKSSAEGKYV